MARTFPLFLLLLISFVTYSQSDFRAGFVVTNQLDTIKGLVDHRDGSVAYEVCVFKKAETAEPTSYYPGDIKLYGFVDDKIFEARGVIIDKIEKTAFLEVVVRGTVSLFRLNDMYWVEKKGPGLQQLTNNVTGRHYEHNKTTISTDNRHIGVLTAMMHDCQDVKRDVGKVQLNKRSLTNLVVKYNKCAGDVETVVYQSKKPWAAAKFGLLAGVNSSQLHLYSSGFTDKSVEEDSKGTTSMIVGPIMDLYFPRAGDRMAFTMGLLYFSATYDIHYHAQMYSQSKTWTIDDYITSEMKQLQIPLGAKYTFPSKKKVLPYVNGGIIFVRTVGSTSKWKQKVTFNSEVTETDKGSGSLKPLQAGLWGGIGVTTPLSKKLSGIAELRGDITNGLTPTEGFRLTSSIVNYQLVVGIRMK